jgi:hypothetical protein
VATSLQELTKNWGSGKDVDLYLGRCQHDTPEALVRRVWKLVKERRDRVSKVVDFGAGDGRFALPGEFDRYIGFEIDERQLRRCELPHGAVIINSCAFSSTITDADLCIGNSPFVRNQDLPSGWRNRAASVVEERTGARISGLANAWQYFALLALASTKADGLVALVMPYEWVSRPSARALRDYVTSHGWSVSVYRLRDETFDQVLTTSSITIIDKRNADGQWRFFEERERGAFKRVASPTGAKRPALRYSRSSDGAPIVAHRGLSPGTQEYLTLTEAERAAHKLRIGVDVVRCVTSLRPANASWRQLTQSRFDRYYKDAGAKCWLIQTNRSPSRRLQEYLQKVPRVGRQTSTCLRRQEAGEKWWRFKMPPTPRILIGTGFSGARPKAVQNVINAVAVGSVSGIFGGGNCNAAHILRALHSVRLRSRIVPHSNGLRKLEVGQLETILSSHSRRQKSIRRQRIARK